MKHAHTARHPPQVNKLNHNRINQPKKREEISRNKVSVPEGVLGSTKV